MDAQGVVPMTLGSNTAQTREIGELRNHLKWMDEERRKSGRKLTELEQRLAQQGRELTERDQKIQELEWHIANLNERLERVPEADPNAAAHEQRLQDLEWHLSNLSTQLARQPNPEEERARLAEEIGHAVLEVQQRVQADQTQIESRLVAEMAALREAEDRLALQFQVLQETMPSQMRLDERLQPVVGRQDEQTLALGHLGEQITTLQENLDVLSAQLHDRTVTLAAESQTNYASLANRVQEYLDALAEQFETRTAVIEADWQQRLDTVANRVPEVSPEFLSLSETLADYETRTQALEAQIATVASESDANLRALAVESDANLRALAAESDANLRALAAEVQTNLTTLAAGFEQQLPEMAEAVERVPSLAAQVANLEESIAKLGKARELMPLFDRLEQELELRQAEEVRLANLITTQEGRFAPLASALEETRDTSVKMLSRLSEVERIVEENRRSAQDFNDNWKPILTEVSRRVGPLTERLTVLNNSVLKAEASLQSLNSDQSEMRETLATLADQVHRSRTETGRQLEAWQATIDEHKDTIERFTQQWLTLSNQYKEARMAVQNFAHWQKQLEQQKREASEMLRIESNRMQSRWEGFLLEIQEKLKNFELDLSQKWQAFELENEQKWAGARRSEQVWREQLGAVDELIQKLQQDNRNLIWRVQAAQADAIKKWPRLLMEEVEKAVELNPNRRLSPSGAAPRGDMSVIDAIEQGLITIDYSDDAANDR
jgi:chromosome segregation ATPase